MCLFLEVSTLSLEALKRNGHNLDLGRFNIHGPYSIPVIKPVHMDEKIDWIPFNSVNIATHRERLGVHFFIDDYLFQRVWNDPARYATLLSGFRAVMSCDYSMFTDYPVAVQIYNHFRKHQLAAYFQSRGMTVIPSICWSDRASYDWCFDGEPVGGTVAVSSVGTQKAPAARELFLEGYREMMRRLKPEKIIFFGDVPSDCEGNIERLPTYYKSLANAQKKR